MEKLIRFKAGWIGTREYRAKVTKQEFVDGNLVETETLVPKSYAVYAVLEENPEKLAEVQSRLIQQGEEYYEQEGIENDFELVIVEDGLEFAGCTTFITPQKLFTCGYAVIGVSKNGARAGKMFCNLEEDTSKSDDLRLASKIAFQNGVDIKSSDWVSEIAKNILNTTSAHTGKDDDDYRRLKSRKTSPVAGTSEPPVVEEKKTTKKAKTKADPDKAELEN